MNNHDQEIERRAHPENFEPEDTGHINLVGDLKDLLENAEAFEYHDFKNTKYATPKIELVKHLELLAANTKKGRYDN